MSQNTPIKFSPLISVDMRVLGPYVQSEASGFRYKLDSDGDVSILDSDDYALHFIPHVDLAALYDLLTFLKEKGEF